MKKILILIIILILSYGVWKYFIAPEGETPYWERNPGNNQSPTPTPNPSPSPSPATSPVHEGNVWYGTLRQSSAPAKGNLMLELRDSDRTVYIQTTRDFSSLYDKEVKVTIDGDFSSFSLVGIEKID